LISGILHIQNTNLHLVSIVNYRIVPYWIAPVLAVVLPVIHVVTGIAFLLFEFHFASCLIAIFVFGTYSIAQIYAFSSGLHISCGCFGTSSVEPVSLISIFRTLTFLGLTWLLTLRKFAESDV
jgi:hypothetical protein